MYDRLGIQGAGGLVAGLATVLSVTPFLLFVLGAKARGRSPFAKQLARAQAEREEEELRDRARQKIEA